MEFLNSIKVFFTEGSERSLNYKRNTVFLFLLKGTSLLISLLYVPLLLNAMDTENYGIWLTLTSIVSWVAMMDIGLGNGLRNKLATALAQGDYEKGREYISSAYIALGVYMSALIFVICVVSYFLNWNSILNAPNTDGNELKMLVIIVFITHGITFVLNLINSILLALQSPALSSLIGMLGQLGSLVIVWACVYFSNIHSLLILGSIVSIVPVIVLLLSTVVVFTGKYKYLSPKLVLYNKKEVNGILSLGLKFFFIQIMTLVLYQTNNIIIANVINNTAVVEYNVAYKYMGVLYTIYIILITPLWSATTDAFAKGEYGWIKNTQNRLFKIALLFVIIGVIMVAISSPVYKFWLHKDSVTIGFWTTLLSFLYVAAKIMYGNFAYIINGIGKLHAQMVITSIMAVLYIPVAIYAGKLLGIYGVIGASILVNILNFAWSSYQYGKLVSNTATRFWNK